MDVQAQVLAQLAESAKFQVPFPHFFAQNVFPAKFYGEIQQILAKKTDFHTESFKNREFADQIDIPGLEFMLSKQFVKFCLYLFKDALQADFGGKNTQFSRDLRLIRDSQNYKIGPHTDTPAKVLSLLFYLPPDDSLREYGTSIFMPEDAAFRCPGGPHYPFEGFRETWRAPFIPNSCLGFWKTDHSFHGVLPIPATIRRDVLLYNIYRNYGDGGM